MSTSATAEGAGKSPSQSIRITNPPANFRLLSIVLLVLIGTMMATLWEASAHEMKIGNLVIKHPWSRQSPIKATTAAGFLKIENTGTTDDRLIKATAEITGNVQLHDMKMEGDMMTMFELPDGIPVPAGTTVELKPKSLHVMFVDVSTLPMVGTSFKGTLTFEKAGTIEVDYEVLPLGEEPNH